MKYPKVNAGITTLYLFLQILLLVFKLTNVTEMSWWITMLPSLVLFCPIILLFIWVLLTALLNFVWREVKT